MTFWLDFEKFLTNSQILWHPMTKKIEFWWVFVTACCRKASLSLPLKFRRTLGSWAVLYKRADVRDHSQYNLWMIEVKIFLSNCEYLRIFLRICKFWGTKVLNRYSKLILSKETQFCKLKNSQWSDCRLPKNLLKNDEKQFLFHLKSSFDIKSSYALFVLLIFWFLISWFFDHIGKRLDKKAIVILKFMNSPIGKLIITTQILPNISRIKRNQTMKFGVLTKTRNDLKPPETI